MITVIVEFNLLEKISREQAKETFLSTTPKYKKMAGLQRKYYFLSEDGTKAGGIYLWNSREDADRIYTEEWKRFVQGKHGMAPLITYLECPVVVNNISNEIISD